MKNLIRILSFCLTLLLCLPFSVACNNTENNTTGSETEQRTEAEQSTEASTENSESETEVETEPAVQNITLLSPTMGETLTLANDTVYEWCSTYKFGKSKSEQYYDAHQDLYYPNPVTLSWSVEIPPDYYRLTISRRSDLSDGESYLLGEPTLTLEHLLTGFTYYWQVDAVYADKTLRSALYTFHTKDSIRAVRIDGVSNTRDIGGLETADGRRIKQGMIYRGGKLDDVTEEGRDFFVNILGLKTDLDLRTPDEGSAGAGSPLGKEINYVNINGRYYVGSMGIHSDEGKQTMAEELRVFTKPENYPIYIHCSLGRDRTGTLVYLIEALLGVQKNTLYMDYEFSVFSVSGTLDKAGVAGIRSNIESVYNYINGLEGKSLSEKAENYMLDIGLTPEEIATIKDLLLEEVK